MEWFRDPEVRLAVVAAVEDGNDSLSGLKASETTRQRLHPLIPWLTYASKARAEAVHRAAVALERFSKSAGRVATALPDSELRSALVGSDSWANDLWKNRIESEQLRESVEPAYQIVFEIRRDMDSLSFERDH